MPTTEEYLTELIEQKTALADKLNEKGVNAEPDETFNSLIPKIDEVHEIGRTAGREDAERFFTFDGLRKSYESAFTEQSWSGYEFTYDPKYHAPTENVYKMFFNYQGKYLPKGMNGRVIRGGPKTLIDAGSKCSYTFAWCQALVEIYDIGLPVLCSLSHFAYKASNLQRIEIIRVNESTTFTDAFVECSALVDVRFEGTIGQNGLSFEDSPNLSVDSMVNILECLVDYSADASGKEWVLTLGPKNLEKLNDTEKETATAKGWTLK